MDNPFETPTQAPVGTGNSRPWLYRFEYKSGKTPEGFAKAATPDQVKAGFSYYDKENGQTIHRDTFTVFVVACLSGISGVTKDGDKYLNYYSTLVFDTRTQPMSVFMQGIERPIESGLYADLKPKMPQGVRFTQVLICYDMETKQLIALNLTVGLAMQIQRAIGAASNTPANKISLFSLCDLSTEFWGLRFTGNYEKKTKEGDPWNGKGEMFFMPEVQAGVVTFGKKPEMIEELNQYADGVREYISAGVARIQEGAPAPGPTTQPTATGRQPDNARPVAVPDGFPTDDLTSHSETDDLPF